MVGEVLEAAPGVTGIWVGEGDPAAAAGAAERRTAPRHEGGGRCYLCRAEGAGRQLPGLQGTRCGGP